MESVKKKEINDTHLGYIQNVITRMGQNSFQAKGWCITIDSALIAFDLANKDTDVAIIISLVVTALFCLLDTYYLYLERGYRSLYNMAANIEKRDKEYRDYSMTIPKSKKGIGKYFLSLFRFSTGLFYLSIIIGLVIMFVL